MGILNFFPQSEKDGHFVHLNWKKDKESKTRNKKKPLCISNLNQKCCSTFFEEDVESKVL